jgi:hypothetical protein
MLWCGVTFSCNEVHFMTWLPSAVHVASPHRHHSPTGLAGIGKMLNLCSMAVWNLASLNSRDSTVCTAVCNAEEAWQAQLLWMHAWAHMPESVRMPNDSSRAQQSVDRISPCAAKSCWECKCWVAGCSSALPAYLPLTVCLWRQGEPPIAAGA